MLKKTKVAVIALFFFLAAACVTVNIYFPAAEVEKAAEQIVEDVYGIDNQKEKQESNSSFRFDWLDWLKPRLAHAQDATTVSNAQINGLKKQIANHHQQLTPFYQGGQVGVGKDGLLAERNTKGMKLKDAAKIRRLIKADNSARRKLYQEVSRALNLQSHQTAKVQQIFADQWRSKARAGWWIQNNSGKWRKK